MLPRIMEYNLRGAWRRFAVVAEVMGENTEGLSVRDAALLAVEAVDVLIEDCGIATGLEELGIPRGGLSRDGAVAMTVARPLENNPAR
jgi:alcohol dehydrogenase